MKAKNVITALAMGLALAPWALAQAPPLPVAVDKDSDGLIDINSLEDLDEMRNDLAGGSLRGSKVGCPDNVCRGYELTRTLDFDSNGDGISDWNNGSSWVPVGTAAAPFTAEFNGNGHAIRHLYLRDRDGVTSYGLFGVTDGASFITVRLENVYGNITPTNRNVSVGTLAGHLSNGYARFVYVTGAEMLTNTLTHAGGIFGRADRSTILEVQFSGELFVGTQLNDVGNLASAAGIAGRASWTLLQNASARGEIRGPRAAGLVETATNVGIARSFSNVKLIALDAVGGLVGTAVYDKSDAALATNSSYYSIISSYAMGSASTHTNYGGGLVRYVVRADGASGRISNSFARLALWNQETNAYWGNVVQRAENGAMSISNSYWVTDPNGPVLTQRFGNVNAPGYSLQDMKCNADPAVAGCNNGTIFAGWGSSWDFGTTAEMPAFKMNPVYPWISSDTPNGNGDYETIAAIAEKYPSKACANPWYFSAKVKNSPYIFTSTNLLSSYEVLARFNAKEGLTCQNADQPDGACEDYQVSYLCDATPAYGSVYWTPYTDVDNPAGNGDYEPLPAGQLCPAGGPIAITAFVPGKLGRSGPPQKLATFNASEGLRCLNADGTCKDYEVQFQCGDVMSDR